MVLKTNVTMQVSYAIEKLLWWAPATTKDIPRQQNVIKHAQTHGKSFALWLFGDAVFYQGFLTIHTRSHTFVYYIISTLYGSSYT